MSDEQSTLFSRKIEANSCGACDTTQTHAHEQLLELEQNAYHWPASSNPFMRHNYGTNHWGVLPAHWHLLRAMGCPTGSYLCSALHCAALRCAAPHCTALQCTALHCTAHCVLHTHCMG